MQVWLGTSGYSYPDWVGSFYPEKLPSARMFSYYVKHFPLVELNFTFYRMPGASDLERLGKQAPAGFQFLVKLHQAFTHDLRIEEAGAFRAALEPLRERGMLLGLLAQFPQRFHDEPSNRRHIETLAEAFGDEELSIEFRHRSWADAAVAPWLADRRVHLVSVDAPALPGLYPSGLVHASRQLYVRFHSRRASSWYESDKDRYDYLYTDEELLEWLAAISSARDKADRALLLFNNCRRAQAAANAERVRQLLERFAPVLEPVPAFGGAPAQDRRQGKLFE
jgi:uncharacterized protein YecE (DUF72 family)